MDDVTRGAMVKLFEHCDAAASYVEVDSRSDGETAGWSRVDDAHGLNLETLTTPDAAARMTTKMKLPRSRSNGPNRKRSAWPP